MRQSNFDGVELDPKTASAVLAALRVACEHGTASSVLASEGLALPTGERFDAARAGYLQLFGQPDLSDRLGEALALGFIAGHMAPRKRHRSLQDTTSFLMDRDLLVRGAEGESILRLPWFEEELFLGRQLPDIREIPAKVRTTAVENYLTALAGERTEYEFTSYGHCFSVDAVPVRGQGGRIDFVLAIATPVCSATSAGEASETTATRLDRAARLARQRADEHRRANRLSAARAEAKRGESARQAAEQARHNARVLRSHDTARGRLAPLSSRELEVIRLASHGFSYSEIAAQLVVAEATVKTHLGHIYEKLCVRDKTAAVAKALRHGIIE
ncbi:MAG TPA: LuxR C-terminal-related transcriptional regulator [Solirubrobacteraceae bacterium]